MPLLSSGTKISDQLVIGELLQNDLIISDILEDSPSIISNKLLKGNADTVFLYCAGLYYVVAFLFLIL